MTRTGAMNKVKNNTSIPIIKAGKAMISFNLGEMQQATLVQVLFGERIEGARWLYALDESDPKVRELNALVAKLVHSCPEDIQEVCSAVGDDFWALIAQGNQLRALAEKVIWDAFPKQARQFERARILSKLNVGEGCKEIIEKARVRASNSVSELARKEWAHFAKLAETVAKTEAPKDVCMALNILMGIGDILAIDLCDWPRHIRCTKKWLAKLSATPPDPVSDVTQNPSLEDILKAIIAIKAEHTDLKSNLEKVRQTLHDNTCALEKVVRAESERTRDKVEIEAKKLEGRKRGLAGPDAWVECFKRFDVASKDDPGSQIEVMGDVMREMKEEGIELGNVSPHKAVEYWREWAKDLKRPQTGEAYDKAKAANKVKKRKARCAK